MCLLYIIEKIWCIFEKNQQILLKILKLAKFSHCMFFHIKNNQNLQKLTKKIDKMFAVSVHLFAVCNRKFFEYLLKFYTKNLKSRILSAFLRVVKWKNFFTKFSQRHKILLTTKIFKWYNGNKSI